MIQHLGAGETTSITSGNKITLCFETGVIHSHKWLKTTGTKKCKAHSTIF